QGLRPGILTGLHLEGDQLLVATAYGTVLQVDSEEAALRFPNVSTEIDNLASPRKDVESALVGDLMDAIFAAPEVPDFGAERGPLPSHAVDGALASARVEQAEIGSKADELSMRPSEGLFDLAPVDLRRSSSDAVDAVFQTLTQELRSTQDLWQPERRGRFVAR
ncbi:MAG: hypothetical protein SGJ19_21315, partial [Planctomycetia bacterium]|nr:hypothetical protein [Planctomycetia bacterium]